MTTKTKKSQGKSTPKPKVDTPVVEAKQNKKSYSLPTFEKKVSKPVIYRLNQAGSKDKKGRPVFPVSYMIRAEDIIYDPEQDTERVIRYIPGETSIFKDEQGKEAKLKEPIIFSNGAIIVQKQNPLLRKFLDMSNLNTSNPNRNTNRRPVFYRVDEGKSAAENVSKEMKKIDATHLALKMPLDKLVGYAKILGINTNKSTDEIRWDMKVLAEKDPTSFVAGYDNPQNDLKQVILKAQEYNMISLSTNEITWVMGDARPLICHVPIGIKPMDKMVDFCMTDEGRVVLDEIKKRLTNLN